MNWVICWEQGMNGQDVRDPHTDLAVVESYFDNEKFHPFDDFHHGYHQDPIEARQRTKAQVVVGQTALRNISEDLPGVYVPCSISSGLRAHQIAAKRGHNTTKKLEDIIGTERHFQDIIEPNCIRANDTIMVTQALFSDAIVIPPAEWEGALRGQRADRAVSRGVTFEEEDYMAGWFQVVDRCRYCFLDGDWHYSRNGILEMFRATMKEAGMIPDARCGKFKEMDIFRWSDDGTEKVPMSLYERAEKVAEYVLYARNNGFSADEGATTLARLFHLHRQLSDPDFNAAQDTPLDLNRVNEKLLNRSQNEIESMERLRFIMEPVLFDDFAAVIKKKGMKDSIWDDTELPPHENAELSPAENKLQSALQKKAALAFDAEPSSYFTKPRQRLKDLAKTDVSTTQGMYDPDHNAFDERWNPVIFGDFLYEQVCQKWERLVLNFLIGALRTARLPLKNPHLTFIAWDYKLGLKAKDVADQKGIKDVKELPRRLKSAFEKQVLTPNLRAEKHVIDQTEQVFGKDRPHIVFSERNIQRITSAVMRYPNLIAEVGEKILTSTGRRVLKNKIIERFADRVVFQDGWQLSDTATANRLHARLVQFGLIDLGETEIRQRQLTIYDQNLEPQSLADDIKTLYQHVLYCIAHDIEAPVQAKALFRLLDMHDMLVDPQHNKMQGRLKDPRDTRPFDPKDRLVDTRNIDPSATAYDTATLKALRNIVMGRFQPAGGKSDHQYVLHHASAEMRQICETLGLKPTQIYGDPHFIIRACAQWLEPQDLSGLVKDYKTIYDRVKGDEKAAKAKPATAHVTIRSRAPSG